MLAFLRRPLLRVIPIGFILLAFQTEAFKNVHPFGVKIQVLLAMSAASGIPGGAERGAWMGFVLGAMYDLGSAYPLGQHALAFGIAGFLAGLVNAVAVDPHWWLKLLFVMAGATAGELVVPLVDVMTSDHGWQGGELSHILPVIAVSSGVFAWLFMPLGRWCLAIRKRTWKVPPA